MMAKQHGEGGAPEPLNAAAKEKAQTELESINEQLTSRASRRRRYVPRGRSYVSCSGSEHPIASAKNRHLQRNSNGADQG
jgi:hypothetical protein